MLLLDLHWDRRTLGKVQAAQQRLYPSPGLLVLLLEQFLFGTAEGEPGFAFASHVGPSTR